MVKIIKGNFRGIGREAVGHNESGPAPDYRLRFGIAFSDPLIWRRVLVSGDLSLKQLHQVIQACMGWQDCSAHRFLVGKIFYETDSPVHDEAVVHLRQLEEAMNFIFTYLYDGGQGWEVQITLEDIVSPAISAGRPVLLGGERGCPPEDIGDIHEYQALLSALSAGEADQRSIRFQVPGADGWFWDSCDEAAIKDRIKELFPDT